MCQRSICVIERGNIKLKWWNGLRSNPQSNRWRPSKKQFQMDVFFSESLIRSAKRSGRQQPASWPRSLWKKNQRTHCSNNWTRSTIWRRSLPNAQLSWHFKQFPLRADNDPFKIRKANTVKDPSGSMRNHEKVLLVYQRSHNSARRR